MRGAQAGLAVLLLPSFLCYLLYLHGLPATHLDPETTAPTTLPPGYGPTFPVVSGAPGVAEEESWWNEWEEVQQSRRVAVHQACRSAPRPRLRPISSLLAVRKHLYNFLVDEKHKTLYCYVPKVACTNWKRLMMILSGRSNATNPLTISSHVPHEEGALTRLSSLSVQPSVLSHMLHSYTKFMFVRHPLERLVSAYRNKLVINSSSAADFKRRFGVAILKRYRNKGYPVPKSGHGVTFPEFVQYLVDVGYRGGRGGDLNEHWAPYLDLCHPCSLKYDVIGKYETLEEDAEYLLSKLDAPPDIHFPPIVASHTASLVTDHMASLPDHLSLKLYQLYEPDFKMFQYDFWAF